MPTIYDGIDTLQSKGFGAFAWRTMNHFNLWAPPWNTVTSRYPVGTNIFDREWDLLIILDTCRVDALRTVSDAYPWLSTIDRMWSVGSMSAEWTLNTFTEDYRKPISETAFVSGNHWTHRIFNEQLHTRSDKDHVRSYEMLRQGLPDWSPVSAEAFAHYETVFATGNQNDSLHPENDIIPHIVTDRAIDVARKTDYNRLIVHYMLPHLKFIADALDWRSGELSVDALMAGPDPTRELRPEEASYKPVENGNVDPATVRDAYRQNLRLVLDYVEILLHNVEAETAIISADHGEGLGDHGIWAHPYGCPFPSIRSVPWAQTTATDECTYESQYEPLNQMPDEKERMKFLKQMGYLV